MTEKVTYVKTIMSDLWNLNLLNIELILFNEKNETELFTYSPFIKNKCGKIEVMKNKIISTNKKRDYNNCTLRMITRLDMLFMENSTKTGQLEGFEMSIIYGEY
jgi:hypothetical protein